jgi:transketolase
MPRELEELSINTLRTLAMDAVQEANSGHPGAPMGLAPAAYAIWTRHLRHAPTHPDWPDRDRFVLSNGHASMLLYGLLHLTGYDAMTLEEIQNFRQWGSLTPGHPESHLTPGVEVTTGPLGQGFGNAVGLALAEAHLHATYDGVVDHFTYGICSDGDLMEGVASEAASLAGHLGLGKLVMLYDDNHITIDGRTDLAFSEDVRQRFEAYGWHTDLVEDGNDVEAIDRAITEAREVTDRPSLISVRTIIGYGSPNKADTSSAHGSPLGDDEIALTKEALGWPYRERFVVPDEVREHMDARERGDELVADWEERLADYRGRDEEAAAELERRLSGELPEGWDEDLPVFEPDDEGMATRKAGGKLMPVLYERLPELVGGSADLAGSNKTLHEEFGVIAPGDFTGQNIHFGIREHAMCAIANGLNVHRGVRGFGATFLVFSDYMRPSLRLAALMEQPTLMVFTHDSIGLGEDGPTHQPIEHLSSLRAMPHFYVLRPADANEVRECWQVALEHRDGPSALVLTRQSVPTLDREALGAVGDARRGAYIVAGGERVPDVVLLATGSEVAPCVEAWRRLEEDGIAARVVSMPCWKAFESQPSAWRDKVLPPSVGARLSVEAGATLGWERWVGSQGDCIGLDRFGASAPAEVNFRQLGFAPEAIVERARQLLD